MAAEKGISLKVKTNGTVFFAGVMSKKIKYGGEPIEITSDDDGGFRKILTSSGSKSIDVSIEAVMKVTTFQVMHTISGAPVFMFDLEFGNGDVITGRFAMCNTNLDIPHDGVIKFSTDLRSSGAYTFQANE